MEYREELNRQLSGEGIEVQGAVSQAYAQILTPDALRFVAELVRQFNPRRKELLRLREERQQRLNAGENPDFLPETAHIRASDWKVAPPPPDLLDRRVEITGPVDRKMIINALNSGAKVFMADFEDANSPTWDNCVQGQINLYDAVRRTIEYTSPEGKEYRLNEQTAVLCVRPRGWHLPEKHLIIDGEPAPGALMDFGLYFYHNAQELIRRGTGPYFYLPKLESHLEARLWNEVFLYAQEQLGIPRGTIRATVLIENILAAFECEEILYELREHSAGLNSGRWDYLFSIIRKFRNREDIVLPDRATLTMTVPFMKAYSELVVQSCHKRGIHAIGGMSAYIPRRDDPAANEAAIAQVVADKEREVSEGYDGTWVAHPGLVPVVLEVFNKHMPTPNQIEKVPSRTITAHELLDFPRGAITEKGMRTNINVSLRYLDSWLQGTGAVAINYLMEDAATVEISRSQLWQWVRRKAQLTDGRVITAELFQQMLSEELQSIKASYGSASHRLDDAAAILRRVVLSDEFVDFVTLVAYEYIS
ncbi:MAG: malate synthase A [Fimbriimonadales bacterium]|nr:malate synthase A [Fimbriimonadales bacterium]